MSDNWIGVLPRLALLVIWGAGIAFVFWRRGRSQGWKDTASRLGDLCLMGEIIKEYERKHGRLSLEECRVVAARALRHMKGLGLEGRPNEMAMFRYAAGRSPGQSPGQSRSTDEPGGSSGA